MAHKAQALVLSCIDFRFRKPLFDFLENELNLHAVDYKADAGGVKQLIDEGPVRDWILENIRIAERLHSIERIILINHQDCGAYGGSDAFRSLKEEIDFHTTVLRHAISIVRTKFPDMIIEAFLGRLGDHEQVTFEKID